MTFIKEAQAKLRGFLVSRQQAYQQVFNLENQFTPKVLADLARFCRADRPTFHSDPRIHAALEGRREVWLRIQSHLKLDPDSLVKLYTRKDIE